MDANYNLPKRNNMDASYLIHPNHNQCESEYKIEKTKEILKWELFL